MREFINIIVGSGEGSNIIFDDDYLSTRHARFIAYDDGTVTVEDLGTTNGTWINDVRTYGPRQLHLGDKVRVGHTNIPIPSANDLAEMKARSNPQ